MPARTTTSPSLPSSSGFGQHTPALSRHASSSDVASSSSPATDVIATPTDRYDASNRHSKLGLGGGNSKQQPRRSMRIRTSSGGISGGGGVDSSSPAHPHHHHALDSSASFLDDEHVALPTALGAMPARSRAVRTSSTPAHHGGHHGLGALPGSSRPSLSAQTSSEAYQLAQQQHGITADQFEDAKQQVMRFLRPDGSVASASQQPHQPFQRASNGQHQPVYSNTARAIPTSSSPAGVSVYPSSSSAPFHPFQQSLSRTPTSHHHSSSYRQYPQSSSAASAALQSALDLDAAAPFGPASASASGSAQRARSAFDDAMTRSAKRQKTSSGSASVSASAAVRQWAAQDGSASSSASSSSDDDEGPVLASLLGSHQRRAAAAAAGGGAGARTSPNRNGLLPSPSLAAAASASGSRGVLERYLTERPSAQAAAPEKAVPQVKVEEAHEQAQEGDAEMAPKEEEEEEEDDEDVPATDALPASRAPPSSSTFSTASLPPIPASPVARKPLTSYPAHALLSPAPSRPKNAQSALFSPDVARLLRSELDELEKKERRSGGSPRRVVQGDRSSDIVVDDNYSSPYQRNASPFSPSGTSRSRDIFGSDESASKRARWNTVLTAQQESGLASPTPSSASMSMRAPSFCDSSPAVSDRGSVASRRSQPSFLHTIETAAAHPASAPDFLYGGVPSSSPTSSQHSEYLPARNRYHRSSPGPAEALAALRSDDSSADASVLSTSAAARTKRGPLVRSATMGGAPPYGQGDPHTKPTFSYAALIGQALFSTPDLRMALADIYLWVMKHYPFFKRTDQGWQNSIRHNLSLNQAFVKTPRGPDNPGKGCLWAIKPGTEDQFVDGDFVRKVGQPSTRRSRGKGGKKADQATALAATAHAAAPGSAGSSGSETLLRAASAVEQLAAGSSSSSRRPSPPGSGGRSARNAARQASPASSRGVSPALSAASSSRHSAKLAAARAYSPALSVVSARSSTPSLGPSPLPPTQLELAPAPEIDEHPPRPDLTFTMPAPMQRPATAAGMGRTESEPHLSAQEMTLRSHSSMGFIEQQHPPAAAQQPEQQAGPEEDIPVGEHAPQPIKHEEVDVKPRFLTAPPVSRTMSLPVLPSASSRPPRATYTATSLATLPASPPSRPPMTSSASTSHLHEPLLSATMSPPTSVYHRLAGPYQPLSYGSSSASLGPLGTPSRSTRALALLASPEAGGIIAGHPGDRPALLSVSRSSEGRLEGRRLGSPAATGEEEDGRPSSAPFLPAPQIFPGTGAGAAVGAGVKRKRTDSDKEDRALQSMLSPGALVHTQSPISSVRGGPRQPMSPVQNASAQLEPCPDPEKKAFSRPLSGRPHLPAVNALASSAHSSFGTSAIADPLFDPFRSPPPSGGFVTPNGTNYPSLGPGAAKAHLRSPSSRLQAALATPGGTKGRVPLGFSPSLAGVGGAWGVSHPSSSSRSGWEDDAPVSVGAGVASWPNTPGMGFAREW
ncbi:hypothetical protein JCM8097_007595 [Rhodosporidiobolus ruineniae]